MALYRPNYWNNYPAPFYADWKQEPIPGWGVRPVMAGPARVGVGASDTYAMASRSVMSRVTVADQPSDEGGGAPPEDEKAPLPRVPGYVWVMTGVFILGGGVALARNMGWTKGIETRIRRLR